MPDDPGTSDAPAMPEDIKQNDDGEWGVDVVVDGETVFKPLTELKTAAAKVAGADERFREAAEIRKAAENIQLSAADAIEGHAIHKKLKAGEATEDEINRYCEIFETGDEYRQALLNPQQPPTQDDRNMDTNNPTQRPKSITLKDLDPALQETLRAADKIDAETQREQALAEINYTIDKSPVYVKLLEDIEDEFHEGFKQVLEDEVRNDLVVRMQANQRYGPQLLSEVVTTVLANHEKLASHRKKPSTPGPMGIGGSGASFETHFPDGKAPERVAGDVSNAKARFMHKYMTGS